MILNKCQPGKVSLLRNVSASQQGSIVCDGNYVYVSRHTSTGEQGILRVSTDGTSSNTKLSGITGPFYMCVTSTGKLIAAGGLSSDANSHYIRISTNAANSFTTVDLQDLDYNITHVRSVQITPTGRILVLAYASPEEKIIYSDDDGVTWQLSEFATTGPVTKIYRLSTGRLVSKNIWSWIIYSDDNGLTWVSTDFYATDVCVGANDRVFYINYGTLKYTDDIKNHTMQGESGTSVLVDNVYSYSNLLAVTTNNTVHIFMGISTDISLAGIDDLILYSNDNCSNITSLQYAEGVSADQIPTTVYNLAYSEYNSMIYFTNIYTLTTEQRQVVKVGLSMQPVLAHAKYLDQLGADELVTQFKAYVDSLV